MAKKRRNNQPRVKDDEPNLDKFDENHQYQATTPMDGNGMMMDEDQDNGNAVGGVGGGMSRAAKKRAKKRAKTAAAGGGTNHNGDNGTTTKEAKKKSKMQLPLDDDDDDDDDDDEDDALMSATNIMQKAIDKKTSSSDTTKKKKKKSAKTNGSAATKKSPEEVSGEQLPSVSKNKNKKRKNASSIKEEEVDSNKNDVELDQDNDDNEAGPELEALLSTLTPLQVLMLDEDALNRNQLQPSAAQMMMTEEGMMSIQPQDDEDSDNEEEEEMMVPMASPHKDGQERSPLEGINPLDLIGDITTQHRAKILLSSLLSPSNLTLHDFYTNHWGKRPLLACLQEQINEDGSEIPMDEDDVLIATQHAQRLNGFLNRSLIDTMIHQNKLRYGLDLNVTKYTDTMGNGRRHRITLDPQPKKRKQKATAGKRKNTTSDGNDLEYIIANPQDVWSNVDTASCSLRLLRPHEHNDTIHTMLSLLEVEFGCMVGSNAYLTPRNSQGFAPHYDDVDVFILQLEGYKRWRVYAPMNKRETLPRVSSRDYTEKEMEGGDDENENNGGADQELDVVLGPGDVLYLPRGWIHQAETVARPNSVPKLPDVKDDHSLHLTVSAMQNWSWADFLEMVMPEALEGATTSDKSTSLREGLPKNFLSYMGTMHQIDEEELLGEDNGGGLPEGLKQVAEALAKAKAQGGDGGEEDELGEEALAEAQAKLRTLARQKQFKDEAKKRIMRVCKQAMSMLDDACDQIGKRFLSDRLPPALLENERSLTKEGMSDSAPHHHDATKKIWPNTLCRLARPNIARLVMEEDKAVLYHCLDNSRVFHGTPLSPMEFEVDDAPALEQLLTTVEPHWIMVKDLIHGDVEDKMEIAQALFDEGLLATMLMETPDRSVQTG